MAARITREFLDRMRDDPDFLEATPGDASEAVAIIDLAISALSHPAALERAHKENEEACRHLERLVANVAPSPTKPLAGDLIGLCTQVDNLMCWVRERARAEERERCAKIAADRIMAARLGDLDADLRSIAGSIDHDIRALSAPRPSPEAEPVDLSGGPPNDKLKTLYAEGRAMLATPPALAPELWERVRAVLRPFAREADYWHEGAFSDAHLFGVGNVLKLGDLRAARALLSTLPPQTDGGAK